MRLITCQNCQHRFPLPLDCPDLGDKRHEEERRRWKELESFSAGGDHRSFWLAYASYLEWNGITSRQRELIYDMAIKAAG